jgi:hypothetical protein
MPDRNEPVLSDDARRWLDSDLDSKTYFARCRELREAEAKEYVRTQLSSHRDRLLPTDVFLAFAIAVFAILSALALARHF